MNTPDERLIQQGKICPYCFGATEFVASTERYESDPGMIYLCRPCEAWVGVHKGTDLAKGRIANAELRRWKIKAHSQFDKLWNHYLELNIPKYEARNKAYQWLAEQMGIDLKDAHIGMFDLDQCKKVILLCEDFQSAKGDTKSKAPKHVVKINIESIEEQLKKNLYKPINLRLQDAKELMVKWCTNKEISAIEIQPYQIRFFSTDKKIDVFPQSRKYHDITLNQRGSYKDLIYFLDTYFCD